MARIATYAPAFPDCSPPIAPPPEPPDFRALYAAAVLTELGNDDPEPYFRDTAPCYVDGAASGKSWCGIFALSRARSAGLMQWLWRDNSGFLSRLGWSEITKRPMVGDICYIDKPHRHHCVVVAVDRDAGIVQTVGANEGTPGAVRGPTTRRISDPRLSFFSIRKWVAAAEERWKAEHA